jgi:tetratricopeptide (TPR) repeat protein
VIVSEFMKCSTSPSGGSGSILRGGAPHTRHGQGTSYPAPRGCARSAFRTLLVLGLAASLTPFHPLPAQEVDPLVKGTLALYRGNYAQAHDLASKYLESHQDSTPGRILLARADIAQGGYEAAYDSLRKALERDPANADALYYLQRLCTMLSQLEFRRLLDTAPDSARAHQLLGESYLTQHQDQLAEREYQLALDANPKSVEILDALGELERPNLRFAEALSYYARALQLAPRDYTSAYGSGVCYLMEHKLEEAIRSFRRALRIDPRAATAHLALGDALLRAGQPGGAVSELKSAAAIKPEMRQAYALLARAYDKLGKTDEAKRTLERERELARQEIRTGELIPDAESAPPASGLERNGSPRRQAQPATPEH